MMRFLFTLLCALSVLLLAVWARGLPQDAEALLQPTDGSLKDEFVTGVNQCLTPRSVLRTLSDADEHLQLVIGDWAVFTNPETGAFTEVIMHSDKWWCVTNAGYDHDYITRKA